jgi:hypothetical protein
MDDQSQKWIGKAALCEQVYFDDQGHVLGWTKLGYVR